MTLVETVEDVAALTPANPESLGFLTQTTLSVDDTNEIVDALKVRFPSIQGPRGEDICYATSNRQESVKAIVPECDKMIVIGSPNSSNSQRLAEVARRSGVPSELVERANEVDFDWLEGVRTLGITAGASAPEVLVRELVDHLATRFTVTERQVETTVETMSFKLPRGLAA